MVERPSGKPILTRLADVSRRIGILPRKWEQPSGRLPEGVERSRREIIGERIIASSNSRHYYDSVLNVLMNQLAARSSEGEAGIEMTRLPAGLSVGALSHDIEQANTLKEGEVRVVYGHGSFSRKIRLETQGVNADFIAQGGKITYLDRAHDINPPAIYGISGRAIKGLQNAPAIDVTLGKKSQSREYIKHLHLPPEKSREVEVFDLATEVLNQYAVIVDDGLFSGRADKSRYYNFFETGHHQCGAQRASLVSTVAEFIDYSNYLMASEAKDKIVPTVEFNEGLVATVDLDLWQEGTVAVRIFDNEGFKQYLKDHGKTVKQESHCSDERMPLSTHDKRTIGVRRKMAERAAKYNGKGERYRVNPRLKTILETSARGELMNTHHVEVLALLDSNLQTDVELAKKLDEMQIVDSACVRGYDRDGALPMGLWKQENPNGIGPDFEEMNGRSAAALILAPAKQVDEALSGVLNLYNLLGAGATQERPASYGSHPYTQNAKTGVVVGIENPTLISTPIGHEIKMQADSIAPYAGSLLLVSDSIIKSAGGEDAFKEKIGFSKNYYSAIITVDTVSGSFRFLHLAENLPGRSDFYHGWLHGFVHQDVPAVYDDLNGRWADSVRDCEGRPVFMADPSRDRAYYPELADTPSASHRARVNLLTPEGVELEHKLDAVVAMTDKIIFDFNQAKEAGRMTAIQVERGIELTTILQRTILETAENGGDLRTVDLELGSLSAQAPERSQYLDLIIKQICPEAIEAVLKDRTTAYFAISSMPGFYIKKFVEYANSPYEIAYYSILGEGRVEEKNRRKVA